MARLLGSTGRAMGAATARGMCIIGPRYTSIVRALPSVVPFIAPEEQERVRGRPFAARLGANENTFGPSPEAISAMREVAADAWMYGDPKSHDLRAAIAARHGVGAANVLVGEGIDGLLSYAAGALRPRLRHRAKRSNRTRTPAARTRGPRSRTHPLRSRNARDPHSPISQACSSSLATQW